MIKEFFSTERGSVPFFHFKLFGFWHILLLLFLIGGLLFIYYRKDQLKKWNRNEKKSRIAMASILLSNMLIYYGSKIIEGTWNFKVHLPLHFCFISGFLFMFALYTNNKKLFRTTYFFSFAGPLPAILLPDLTCGMDRFIFWQFFISHHIFLLFSVYTYYVLDWKIEKGDAKRAFFHANIIFALVFLFNQIFKTNYIMTENLPAHVIKLMPFLKNIDFPIVWLELAGTLAFLFARLLIDCWEDKPVDKSQTKKEQYAVSG